MPRCRASLGSRSGLLLALGLVGGEVNAIAARGPKIIRAGLPELVNMLDLGRSPTEAVAAPRIHPQGLPDAVDAE